MLTKAFGLLGIAIIAALFAFGGFAETVTSAAKVLFGVFLIAFVVMLIAHFTRGARGTGV